LTSFYAASDLVSGVLLDKDGRVQRDYNGAQIIDAIVHDGTTDWIVSVKIQSVEAIH
jgi:hypothetical protein